MKIKDIVQEPICTCKNIELTVPVETGLKKFIVEGKKDGKCPIHKDKYFAKTKEEKIQTEEPLGV